MMSKFKILGSAMIFRCTSTYNAAGFIPSVSGISLDGKFMTNARIKDIIWLE